MTKQTILIVDDLSENVDILISLLSQYDLVTALDGESALEVMQEEEIDLILLDIMMPIMDGFEVCTRLKADVKTAKIPVIFLSAKAESKDIQKGFELGAVDYVTKPFNPYELSARVKTHLKLYAYEKDLQTQIAVAIEKDKRKQQTIYAQAKQAALGEQLSYIAHQWKQPLASLSAYNILQLTKLHMDVALSKEEQIENLNKIEHLIQFMSNTIDTFKDFYANTTKKSDFSIKDTLEKVLTISAATLTHNNVDFDIQSETEILYNAQENEVMQAIFSIINNAIKIFELRKTIHPQLHFTIHNNTLIIEDNGGGIEKAVLNTLFQAFVSTTEGSGVGLYIAKEMIEKNGGTLTAHNSENGAKFIIKFDTKK